MNSVVFTKAAPDAIGPYSQAIQAGNLVMASGQLPVDPFTGKIPGDVQAQTAQSIENLKAILEGAGSSLPQVMKTTVFIKNMDDFSKVNEVYAKYFPNNPPARSCVEVARLPKDAFVEVEAVATI